MKRRSLDLIFAGGGIVVAALLIVLAFAVASQSVFASDYVRSELTAQKITFSTVDKLTAEEKTWKPGSSCLTTYAGQLLQSGAQAECYASYFIALHMEEAANNVGFPGATYATLGATRSDLTAQVTAAKAKGDSAAAADAQKKLDAATALRTTMQTGETLRGLLLTTYGFSVLGTIAGLAANVMYALAGLMILLSVAGLVHALVTPEDEIVFVPAPQPRTAPGIA